MYSVLIKNVEEPAKNLIYNNMSRDEFISGYVYIRNMFPEIRLKRLKSGRWSFRLKGWTMGYLLKDSSFKEKL